MFGRIRRPYIQAFGYGLIKFFKRSYGQVLIDRSFLDLVATHKPQEHGPLIFVPTHRSYLDFLIVSWVLNFFKRNVPFIAAADDMAGITGVT
jgi:glycerol-3-phosphate O-acyltransferase